MKRIFYNLTFWLPFIVWGLIVVLESTLFKIHELFYLVSAFLPFLSLIVFVYFAIICCIRSSNRNRLTLLTVLLICLLKYTNDWISFRTSIPSDKIELNILTWNVQRLEALTNSKAYTTNLNKLCNTIKSSNIDVLVIQEISKKQSLHLIKNLKISSKNIQWSNYYSGSKGGLAVLLLNEKNWSLSNKKTTNLPPSWKCVYSEIKHRSGKKLNIFGVHIVPPKVTDFELRKVTKNILLGKRSGIKKILKRYVQQAKIQTRQVGKINKTVSTFKDPTIIAGDFNSTSQLPIHRELRKNLNDTWIKGGIGLGATRYWANILPFRIDYIYTTKNIKTISTNIGKSHFSDHNPVFSKLYLD